MAVHGQSFVDVALVSEVVARAGGDVGPRRGLLYYLEVWPADLLPWTPFFLLALGYFALMRVRLDASERRAALFPAVWFLVVVGTFSLSSSKLPHYILPAYPAAALLVGLFVDRAGTDAVARRFWWAATGLVVTVLLAASVLTWALLRRTANTSMPLPDLVLPLLLMGGGAVTVLLGWRRGPAAGSAAIAGTLASAVAYASLFVIPHLLGLEPMPPLGRTIAAFVEPGDRVGQYGTFVSGGLVFYSGHRVDMLVTHDDVARFLGAPGRAFCVLARADVAALAARLPPGRLHEIAQQPRLVVRLNRLFGERSPYEEPMVLVSNEVAPAGERIAGHAATR
jgi:4-amino-4-deoxy-L-arabinose transferase-like glycosyltransferase